MTQQRASKRGSVKIIINDILAEKEDESPVETIDDSLSLTSDLGLDSLDLAEMTVRLEDEYGVDVFEDDVVDEVGVVLDKLEK